MIDGNYTGLQVLITERSGSAEFRFGIRNHGGQTLWHLRLRTYDLLGPGAFNLDDTHMFPSLAREPDIQVSRLTPGEEAVEVRAKWGQLEAYRGPGRGTAHVTFSLREDDQTRFGVNAPFVIHHDDGRPFEPVARDHLELHSSNYKLGLAFGKRIAAVLRKRRWSVMRVSLKRPNQSLSRTRYGSQRLAAPGHSANCPCAASRLLPPQSD